jgi:hypothetical protein
MLSVFVALSFVLLTGGVIMAQSGSFTPETVTFEPLIDFSTLFTNLLTAVAPVVAGAIGVGLAIWGTRWLYQRAKSLAR